MMLAGYARNGSQWVCSSGYVGTPVETCSSSACGQPVELSGCLAEQPCKALVLDSCRYEAVGCEGVLGGASCSVRCKSPAEGQAVLASCPEENVNPEQARRSLFHIKVSLTYL